MEPWHDFAKIERSRYGFFIDHTTDIASQVFIFLGLGASPYMHLVLACGALMSYWIAALYTFIWALATDIFQISYWGVGPTEIRLALIGYNLVLLLVGPEVLQMSSGYSVIDIFCGSLFLRCVHSLSSADQVRGPAFGHFGNDAAKEPS